MAAHASTGTRFISRAALSLAIAAAVASCSGSISSPFSQQPTATIQPGQIAGGGTKQMAVDPQNLGGFLPRPDLMQPGGPGRAALVYLNPRISRYHKILLDPVSIWAAPGSQLSSVPADQRRVLANLAYSEIYKALAQNCEMVHRASRGTIHLRLALVDAQEPNAVLNTVATYAPYASSAYSAASLVLNKGVGYFSGTATGEGYATDAMNGALLWEAADKRGGTTAFVANTLDNLRDIRHVFEAWGVQFRTRLQELGVCS